MDKKKKVIFSLLVVVLFISSCTPQLSTQKIDLKDICPKLKERPYLGDSNLDGKTTMDDFLILLEYVLNEDITKHRVKGADVHRSMCNSDINQDGTINIKDLDNLDKLYREKYIIPRIHSGGIRNCEDYSDYALGDSNLDGVINVLDVVQTVSIILGNSDPNEAQTCLLDLNNDGVINVLDVVAIVAELLGDDEDVEGCTDSLADNYDEGANVNDGSCEYVGESTVGEDGGIIYDAYSGTSLQIPAGALTENVTINIANVTSQTSNISLSEGYGIVVDSYSFEPHGQIFNIPVTINMQYPSYWNSLGGDPLPDDISFPEIFFIKLEDELDDSWELLAGNFLEGIGTISIDSFSIFSIAVNESQEDVEGCTDSLADNYDEGANVNDGSCEYVGESTVGEDGGIIYDAYSGTSLQIPAGALTENVTINIANVTSQTSNISLSEGYGIVVDSYSFEPHGQIFNIPVTINMQYPSYWNSLGGDPLPDDISFPEIFFIKLEDELDDSWELLAGNFLEGIGTISIDSFSIFSIAVNESQETFPTSCGGSCGEFGIGYSGCYEDSVEQGDNTLCDCYCDPLCYFEETQDCCSDIDSDNDGLFTEEEYEGYCSGETCNQGELICSESDLQECINEEFITIENCELGCFEGECLSETPSCSGLCGYGYPSECEDENCICWCDSQCSEFGDCCSDYDSLCVSEEGSENGNDDTQNEDGNGNDGNDEYDGSNDYTEEEEDEPLFDLKVNLLSEYNKVSPGDEVTSNIQMFNFGDLNPVDVILTCEVNSFNTTDNTTYDFFQETLAVDLQTSVTRNMIIPSEAPLGSYLMNCNINYQDYIEVSSSDSILVVSKMDTRMPSVQILAVFTLSILLVIATMVIIILIIRIFNTRIKKKNSKKGSTKKRKKGIK